MVIEHAPLSVKPGAERAFEAAFVQAKEIIAGMGGFGRLTLFRCVEQPGTYLLLVEWCRLEDHIEGFRGSPQYPEWRRLLHHFYDPLPTSNISWRSTPFEPLRVPVRDESTGYSDHAHREMSVRAVHRRPSGSARRRN